MVNLCTICVRICAFVAGRKRRKVDIRTASDTILLQPCAPVCLTSTSPCSSQSSSSTCNNIHVAAIRCGQMAGNSTQTSRAISRVTTLPRLSAFATPSLPADLNTGFPDQYIKKDANAAVGVEPVVEALVKVNMQEQCDVCTFRNNLNKIMATPVDLGNAWTVDACTLGTTMFLDIHQLPEKTFPDADRFQYYGYKFEALCTQQSTVDATSEYTALVRLRLDQFRIVLAAEIDCFDPKASNAASPDLATYVELKTFQLPDNARKADNLKRYKYPKWWLQSWLAGVTRVIAGGRDKQGFLQTIEALPTHSLPKRIAEVAREFDPWLLLGFGKDVLLWMQQVTRVHQGQHVRFSYQPAGRQHAIQCQVLEQGLLPMRLKQVLPC